jgi:hypothetical protein
VLLQVVANTGDISGNFHTVGQTHTGDLTQCGVGLLGGGGTNSGAHATLLGGGLSGSLVLKGVHSSLQSRGGGLVGDLLTAALNELVKSRHFHFSFLQFSPFGGGIFYGSLR